MTRQSRITWTYTGLALLVAAAFALAPMLLPASLRETPAVLIASLLGAAFAPLPLLIRGWRGVDEAVDEAHKASFIAGGSLGGMTALVGLVALLIVAQSAPSGPWSALGITARDASFMVAGAMVCLIATALCYCVFWARWWLGKR